MPGVSTRAHGGHVGLQSREIGTHSRNEVWWRDHYEDIKSCGYQLSPRYKPEWVPSWEGSSGDVSVEDEPHCLVSAICLVLSSLTDCISYGPQWMPHAYAMANESCSRRFSLKKGRMNCRSVGCSNLWRSRRTRATIVCHFSMSYSCRRAP